MNDYEKYERACRKIRKDNKSLLDEFSTDLESSGLSEKTIKEHLLNVEFYISDYLLYEDAVAAKDGIGDAGMFFGYWFIKKAMWASPSSMRRTASSLKKFYTFLCEKGLVDQEDLVILKTRIKNDMPEWIATLGRYDDETIENPW